MEKQIHKATVINIETGEVTHDAVYFWDGPVVMAGGKAPKTKMIQPPPASQEEIEARQMANFASRQSLYEQGYESYNPDKERADLMSAIQHRQGILDTGLNQGNQIDENERTGTQAQINEFQQKHDAITGTGGLQFRKRALTAEEQKQSDREQKMMDRFDEELNRRPGEVSPEQNAALNELYGSEQSKMDEELRRFAVEQSGSRGLSMSDTPYARELLRAKSAGQTELGTARASSKLNFAERERLFSQGLAQWKGDLQQQRMANLMSSQGQNANTAIGFMNARGNLKPTAFQPGGGGGSGVGGIISGVGGAIGGIAMAF